MRGVLLASLRTHARRYVAAVLAVVIGVAFIVVTDAVASSARAGLTSGLALPYQHADAVVSDIDGDQAARLMRHAQQAGDRAAVIGWSVQPVSGSHASDDHVEIGAIADNPAQRWQVLEAGHFPRRPGEAVVDTDAAKSNDVHVGDRLRVGTGPDVLETTVVGLVDSPAAGVGAAIYVPWADVARWSSSLVVDSVAYDAGTDTDRALATLHEIAGARVQTPDAFVEHRSTQLNRGVDVLAIVLLLFAAIALFVSTLVIANTFSILFAQRARDFALLRCVGATRRQVVRWVRLEALALGVGSSTLGLVVGAAVGHGLVALVQARWPSADLGRVSLSVAWLGAASAVGVVATVASSWLPTRRVVTVSPLAALGPVPDVSIRAAAGRLRLGAGAALIALGVAALSVAVAASSPQAMVLGGGSSFTGLLLVGPVLVPALIRLVGHVSARLLGPPGRLAVANAVRNPRRTATTTAALLVGVTLTTALLTGLASSRGAVDGLLDDQYPVDIAVTATGAALPGDLLNAIRLTSGVSAAVGVPGVRATVSDGVGELEILAPPAATASVTRSDVKTPGPGRIVLPPGTVANGATVTVTVDGRATTVQATTDEGWGRAGLVSAGTFAELSGRAANQAETGAIWVRAASGADAGDLAGSLTALARTRRADVTNALGDRSYVDLQLNVLTGAVVALLAVAVVIALMGIGNTLGLSVLERGREHALVRALGLSRRQLRRSLAAEALLLSLVATVLGTIVGVTFAWVGVRAMVRPVVAQAPMVLPWSQLALVVVVAGAAGLAACLLPARRAVRVSPATGLAVD